MTFAWAMMIYVIGLNGVVFIDPDPAVFISETECLEYVEYIERNRDNTNTAFRRLTLECVKREVS